ncbi:prepilin-type N-terminal cleavage/methylation domain-containing protein [Jeotgalibaca porci]|uniref:prepilin-type N-terminal cleavage/methylation domain-containing protein n=1 Tax=Jeotgalibaca porci TaxID=1868793 RepID=UPI0035A0B0D8
MRNKIKQLLKKEGGFTLVELLAVLAILALIVAIAVPSIGNVIDGAKTKSADAQVELIEDAARLYDLENDLTADTNINDLIKAGFLDKNDVANLAKFNLNEGSKILSDVKKAKVTKVEETNVEETEGEETN